MKLSRLCALFVTSALVSSPLYAMAGDKANVSSTKSTTTTTTMKSTALSSSQKNCIDERIGLTSTSDKKNFSQSQLSEAYRSCGVAFTEANRAPYNSYMNDEVQLRDSSTSRDTWNNTERTLDNTIDSAKDTATDVYNSSESINLNQQHTR